MTNPYHDENGRFCSKGEMKAIVDQLGKAVADQKAGRGKALSNGERDGEIFDRWVTMKNAYEQASDPKKSDVTSRFDQHLASLKPDKKLQAAVVAANDSEQPDPVDFAALTSNRWAQRLLAKAYGTEPKAARSATKQLRIHQQSISRQNFLAEVEDALREEAELKSSDWKNFEAQIARWDGSRLQGYPNSSVRLHYVGSQRGVGYRLELDMLTGASTLAPISPAAGRSSVPESARPRSRSASSGSPARSRQAVGG